MIINLPSFFSPTPNISTDIGNEGTELQKRADRADQSAGPDG